MTNSTATLEYMRKVRTVFCPDFLAQYKSIPLWRSTVFGWTALDPVLTQNPKKAGRAGRKQRKIRRANGGKKHKSEPKRLRFVRETTYGPEGRGFEHLLVHVHNIHTALPNGIARIASEELIQACHHGKFTALPLAAFFLNECKNRIVCRFVHHIALHDFRFLYGG